MIIDAIPKSMRDELFEELKNWYESEDRKEYLKKNHVHSQKETIRQARIKRLKRLKLQKA